MVTDLIDRQILSNPRIIKAMMKVPRHLFVEPGLYKHAYKDQSLPIGYGQTISHPSTVAIMSELLEILPNHRVLEIGTGSGYQAAILAEISGKVYTIERQQVIARRAHENFQELGFFTIRTEIGDGSLGWPSAAPFDRILVTAGTPTIPQDLCLQLCPGGKLVIPVGDRDSQLICRVNYLEDGFYLEEFQKCKFVDLLGENGWPKIAG